MVLGISLGLSTLVYILIGAIIIRYWQQIFNLIGGVLYLVLFIILAIFMLNTFTDFNLGNKVDIGWYNRLTNEKEDYLIEKKDDTFKKVGEVKKGIDSLDEESNKEQAGFSKIEEPKKDINFEDESKVSSENTKETGIKIDSKDKLKSKSVIKPKEYELKYEDISRFVKENPLKLTKDELKLIEGLTPYIEWEYKGKNLEINSTKDIIKLKVKQ